MLLDLPALRTQEWVLFELVAKRYRECGAAFGTKCMNFLGSFLKSGITRLDRERESSVRLTVLMAAINERFFGKVHQLLQRFPHHLAVSLQNTAAA